MKPSAGKDKFTAVNDFVLKIETFLMALITITLVVVITIEVVCRYIFFVSTAWAEELSRYLFIWLTYIGSAYALNEGSHIEIDVFKQIIESNHVFAKHRAQWLKGLHIAGLASTSVFLILFGKIFFDFMMKFWGTSQTTPTMHIPMGYIYLPVFVSTILALMHCVYLLYETFKGENSPLSKEGE